MRSPRSRASRESRERALASAFTSAGGAPLTPSSSGRASSLSISFEALVLVQGRQGETPVAERLDQYAAGGDHHQRAELGVMYHPERHLDARLHHLLYRDGGAEARGHLPVSRGQDVFVPDTERHPAELRLVGSCGRLQGDRVAEAPGGGQDILEAGRRGGTRYRNPVVCEHLERSGLSEILPCDQGFAPASYGLPRNRVRRS